MLKLDMLKKLPLPLLAFLQATGLVLYIVLVACFFNFVTPLFEKSSSDFLAPIIMLLVFIISAVISATLVLGRAGILFWDKKYKEAFQLVTWTVVFGAIYLTLLITFLALRKPSNTLVNTDKTETSATSNSTWREYTFNEINLTFSAPSEMTVTGKLEDSSTFTLFVQRSIYPNDDYYQLYGLVTKVGTTQINLNDYKEELIRDTLVQKDIAGYQALQGQFKGQRNRFVTYIKTNEWFFTLATSQPTIENSKITNMILDTFKFN